MTVFAGDQFPTVVVNQAAGPGGNNNHTGDVTLQITGVTGRQAVTTTPNAPANTTKPYVP